MLDFFGFFGRRRELHRLDHAIRAAGLHPLLMPEPIKLSALKLLSEAEGGSPDPRACAEAAELLVYCMTGPEEFALNTDDDLVAAVEARIASALDAGDSLDAKLVLLTLYGGVVHGEVAARFDLEAG